MPGILSFLRRRRNRWRVSRLRTHHAGGHQFCPVCQHPVISFTPMPSEWHDTLQRHGFDLDPARFEFLNLASYACPLCGVSDRDRVYAIYFENVLPSAAQAPGFRFVDFAPSAPLSQRLRDLMGPHGTYRTADYFRTDVDDRVNLCDMREVYADASVDRILCSHVIEHVPDDRQAIREVWRVLKPGGCALLMVPVHLDLAETREDQALTREADRWRHFGQGDHVRLHCREDWMAKLKEPGFELTVLRTGDLPPEAMARAGITQDISLYVVRKPVDGGRQHGGRWDGGRWDGGRYDGGR